MFAQGVDVVVGTPGRINELMAKGALQLKRCSTVVLDEVDILLGAMLRSSASPALHEYNATRMGQGLHSGSSCVPVTP